MSTSAKISAFAFKSLLPRKGIETYYSDANALKLASITHQKSVMVRCASRQHTLLEEKAENKIAFRVMVRRLATTHPTDAGD